MPSDLPASDPDQEAVWYPLALIVWLGCLAGFRALTLPDEARYVGIAWSMLESGDWLTPRIDGLPFFHKPPLFYWLTAFSLRWTGPLQFASRLPSLLGAVLGALALWRLVRRHAAPRVAAWTLLALATFPLFFAGAQIASPDMLVSGLVSVSICLAATAVLRSGDGPALRSTVAAAWAAAALAVLAKGLVGLVLPLLVVAVWLSITRRWRSARVLVWPPAMLAFAALALPWFAVEASRFPGFASYFFLHHHLERFVGSGFNNVRPWWFYLAVLPAATLPWSLLLVRARSRRLLDVSKDAADLRLLMWVWLGAVIAFFSFPQSKPISYVMPALFPVAFVVAESACSFGSPSPRLAKGTLALAAAVCLGYVVISGLVYEGDNRKLAKTLWALRGPGDEVAFLANYYYDVPMYARLDRPVRVLGDWRDPDLARNDDWRRELSEAARFAPDLGSRLLADEQHGLVAACGRALWVVAPQQHSVQQPGLAAATLVYQSNGASLWRLAPAPCGAGVESELPAPERREPMGPKG